MTKVYITIMLFLSCYFEYHVCALITDLLMHHIELENNSVEINWHHVFSGCGFSTWFKFSPQSIRLFPSFVFLFFLPEYVSMENAYLLIQFRGWLLL